MKQKPMYHFNNPVIMASPVKKRKRNPNFRIEFAGDDGQKRNVLESFQRIRSELSSKLDKPVGNLQVIETLFQLWSNKTKESENELAEKEKPSVPSTYIKVQKKDVNQRIFLCAEESIKRLVEVAEHHGSSCKKHLKVKKIHQKGHVVTTHFFCDEQNDHSFLWSSSPYLPNQEYLVNNRVKHGFTCSGMLPSHYVRFTEGAGIGKISKQSRQKFFNEMKEHIQREYDDSTHTATLEEVAAYENEELGTINIMSDARHGWRKNAKDTSVVAIGEKSHKVLSCQHVTKSDDVISQRHEKLGTEKIYRHLKDQEVNIGVHAHDRNLSINKFIREECDSESQNDTWHAVKSMKAALKKISSGPAYLNGKTWSSQLDDKVEPISTHFHWAIRNCDEDPEKLKSLLLNIVEHYKNNHQACHGSSRCKKDPNYEISRKVITDPRAEKLLLGVIKNSVIFKHPHDYRLCKDTFYVESFNNVVNVYQDKRISFSDAQYNARTNLAVCHWNENVEREFTSIWKPNHRMPRSVKGKKNYKKCTFIFRENIWKRYVKSAFRKRNRIHNR